jgi:hypothetical protein
MDTLWQNTKMGELRKRMHGGRIQDAQWAEYRKATQLAEYRMHSGQNIDRLHSGQNTGCTADRI